MDMHPDHVYRSYEISYDPLSTSLIWDQKTDVTYSRMVFAEGLFSDGQSVIQQVGRLFIFVLIPERETDRGYQ